ncbi:hypothetical protein SASPL_116354 [Salvia splendens]|uniref:Uncharacterized protein n=1 Tax=Salvia splendens TaxID=180675 RepID=A0A8X8XW77_SALSN|nr:hypothetical protein SASPL_116354 [Salvia splendens]
MLAQSSSLEHSIIAAKNGSFLDLWRCFFSSWLRHFLAEAGGGGRRRRGPEGSVFFGIPGVFSQEKGILIKFRWVMGLGGGERWLRRNGDDSREEESEEFEHDDNDNDRVRREVGRSFGVEEGVWLLIERV